MKSIKTIELRDTSPKIKVVIECQANGVGGLAICDKAIEPLLDEFLRKFETDTAHVHWLDPYPHTLSYGGYYSHVLGEEPKEEQPHE